VPIRGESEIRPVETQNLASLPLRVIYPGIDEIFRAEDSPPQRQQVRTRYGLPDRYLLYVGNIEPRKNVAMLLEVQQRLRQAGLPHKLVLAGQRSWRATRERTRIARAAASGDVVPLGYVARGDLPALYQMADVFLFPSLYEGFGFPPLEAMASGTPVVSSARGALAETMTDAAWIVDPEDGRDIATAVMTLVNDPRTRDQYVERGRNRSRQFTWTKTAEATLSVYEEAAGHHGT